MRLLLDTQIVYWSYYEASRLPAEARKLIFEAEMVFVSAASIWEIAIKSRLGKINANPKRLAEHIRAAGFHELPVLAKHAVIVSDLPLYHNDPFDRLLIAQAISEPLRFVTADTELTRYSDLVVTV
ncbi:MAG: type II toxin-antitoxin system VapC family toxin [Terracidiphilus sp.]|jgi:PIN domain nuclease of toxin-antitoxin system